VILPPLVFPDESQVEALLAKIGLTQNKFAMDKHSSLFGRSISDEEENVLYL
jgi:hypothetical protein